MKGHINIIDHVKVTPDGLHAVSASRDHTLKVWDIREGQCVYTLEGHTNWVMSITITSDGRYGVSYCSDGSPRVWDLSSGQCIRTLEGLFTFYFSPDSGLALSGGYKKLEVWELIWDLEFPDPVDWDEGVRPYLEIFLSLRDGKWTEEDFQDLINELAEKRGYGWVQPEGIRKELEKMTNDFAS
jgi:WD40 repeat protein